MNKKSSTNLIKLSFQLSIVEYNNWMFSSHDQCCDSDTKQHIANMMTVITTSTFALYAGSGWILDDQLELEHL